MITLTSNGTAGTITVTASSTGLEPGVINVYTGGWIYLSASPINVPVNETSLITVTIKDISGIPIKYSGNIDLTVDNYSGSGGFPSSTTCPVSFNNETSKNVVFTAISVGEVEITAVDSTTFIFTPEPENDLILYVIPELNPDHIKVDADPSNIPISTGIDTYFTTITARVEDKYYTYIASYTDKITFTTDKGRFPDDSQEIDTSSGHVTYIDGVATVELFSPDIPGSANISVTSTSVYYGKEIFGNTRVGFYEIADHIDLISIPQSILTGGGSEGTCNIIATIKNGAIVVSGYDGAVTFTILEGYPSGVKFTSTNQSSITIDASTGVATMSLQSKNWVGIAKVRVTASEGLTNPLTADILIPVVPNKNLEIFVLYKNTSNEFMKYYNPADGLFDGEWIPGNITYGKFCVDSDNNLYILDLYGTRSLQKKSSSGETLLRSDEIVKIEDSYTIDNSYAINIGPNGYIYFTLNTDTSMEGPKYCIKKINPNTLIIEDILCLSEGYEYYGFAVDSDGSIYIHNYTEQKIEKWKFESGFITSRVLGANYNLSELAIAGDYIGGIGKNGNAFKILKIFTENDEMLFTLTEITNLSYISSIDSDFLFSGLNINDEVVFGRYDTEGSEIWCKAIPKVLDNSYLDCIIGAYPF
jgi:hypothetical protein